MRRGELLGLRWRDVDLDRARLSVRQQYTRQGNGLGFGPPKSMKSIRTIDVDEETVALLREQQERQRFQRRAWKTAYRADLDLVFCRPGGSPEDPTIIGRRFTRRVTVGPEPAGVIDHTSSSLGAAAAAPSLFQAVTLLPTSVPTRIALIRCLYRFTDHPRSMTRSS